MAPRWLEAFRQRRLVRRILDYQFLVAFVRCVCASLTVYADSKVVNVIQSFGYSV